MSFKTVAQSTRDGSLSNRVTACVADEAWNGANTGTAFAEKARISPDEAQAVLIWPVCSASDIEAAYASALAAQNPDPGGDESVVTDQMILSAVQANWPLDPAS